MKKLFRISRVVLLFSIFLLVLSVKTASAFDFADLLKRNLDGKEKTLEQVEAVVDCISDGTPSRNCTSAGVFDDWEVKTLTVTGGLTAAGIDEGDLDDLGLTEEEKRIVQKEYGSGLISEVGRGIALLYASPPASTKTYVADLLQSAQIIPEAQAQGLGFASLDPILETWKVFRNIAYLFFVIIFLVIGFMIMFRHKIGGQTVVTAQQAIPGVLVSLVFVTFSYAIAGFMIDLMYLLMYLMIGIFQPAGGADILNKNFMILGWELVTGVGAEDGAFASVNQSVQHFAEGINTSALGDFLGWLGGITLGLIVSIAILIGVFKMFFELLKTYITIIIAIATAPLVLMMGAVPGTNNFGSWLKSIYGNLLAFPVVLFALIFYDLFTRHDMENGGFVPPYLIGRGQGGVIMTMVGIGILLIIPELIKEMKKALKVDGGVWETLLGSAVKNAQSGEVLFPTVSATTAGGYGGYKAYRAAQDQGLSKWETAKAVVGGGVEIEGGGEHDKPIHVGGAARYASKGVGFGRMIRKKIDRLQEGRAYEPEDTDTLLTNIQQGIIKQNKKTGEKSENQEPTGSQPEGGF